jgi:hypothetical protein
LHQVPEKAGVPASSKHPSVQVAALLSGYPGMQARIYEIRPYLERLDIQASCPQGGEQSEGDCRFAAPAVRPAYQEGVFLSEAAGHIFSLETCHWIVKYSQMGAILIFDRLFGNRKLLLHHNSLCRAGWTMMIYRYNLIMPV